MNPEVTTLVRYRLARARESLAEAELLFAHDHVQTAVNRLYYADLVTFDRAEVSTWMGEATHFVEQVARSAEGSLS